MDSTSSKDRAKEAERLIKIGLINTKHKITDANEKLKTLNVWGGDKKSVDIFSKEEISITVPKRIKKKYLFLLNINLQFFPNF